MQGHVTFRGLNKKKKLFYCNSAFLFILLVWAFKAVLVAMRLAQHISVSHFLLISKCTFVAYKQPMVTLVLIVGLLQPMLREGTGRAPGGLEVFEGTLPRPLLANRTFYCCFLFCFAKQGNSHLRTLLSALYKRTTVCCFYFILVLRG